MHTKIALLVDDDPLMLGVLARELRRRGEGAVAVTNTADARVALSKKRFSFAVLDFHLGGDDVGVVVHELAEASVPFLFFTGSSAEARDSFPAAVVISKGGSLQRLWVAVEALRR